MKLNDEERQIMVSLEYEKAQSFFEQAEKIAAMDLWDVVANRLYYAVFHAVSALLIKDGIRSAHIKAHCQSRKSNKGIDHKIQLDIRPLAEM